VSRPPVTMETASLIADAKAVRENAHAPYSKYKVGAALLTKSGRVFVGCNVENASYGATICAERNAIAQMVAAGERHPVACVVVTQGDEPGSPCGMCRQVLAEFAVTLPITLVAVKANGGPDALRTTTLEELLPDAFSGALLEAATTAKAKKAKAPTSSREPSRARKSGSHRRVR
jgi:cytidine deaminase